MRQEPGTKMSQIVRTTFAVLAFSLAVVLAPTVAFAQTPQDWALCLGLDLRSPDFPIQGCTAVIETGRQVLERLAAAFNNRGVAYRVKGEYDKAIADFNEAIKLRPEFANAFNNRGVAYRNVGDLGRAVADYDQAIRLKPDYTAAFYNRGIALNQRGEYERAVVDFTSVLRVDPNNATVLYRRGAAYLSEGDVVAGNADIAAAKASNSHIEEEMARTGL
jgi:tetratricopeptide (TPR) repeat protein